MQYLASPIGLLMSLSFIKRIITTQPSLSLLSLSLTLLKMKYQQNLLVVRILLPVQYLASPIGLLMSLSFIKRIITTQ
ncbi:hypothetical protein, partial [Shigella sp. FC1967]|uniref:hypothetical protein n=1 Tax=Shigella sp. FC1967 TaxID=1898041 RepID=UPI001C0A7673